jgi:hypothetical protein
MASRDLTNLFVERRSAFLLRRRPVTSYTHDLSLRASNESLEMTSLKQPPAWVDAVHGVEQCLLDITNAMDDLKSMHASRVGSVFGKDLETMEGTIERKTRDITDLFRHAEQLLQTVGRATRRAGGEEATVGANVQRRYVISSWN